MSYQHKHEKDQDYSFKNSTGTDSESKESFGIGGSGMAAERDALGFISKNQNTELPSWVLDFISESSKKIHTKSGEVLSVNGLHSETGARGSNLNGKMPIVDSKLSGNLLEEVASHEVGHYGDGAGVHRDDCGTAVGVCEDESLPTQVGYHQSTVPIAEPNWIAEAFGLHGTRHGAITLDLKTYHSKDGAGGVCDIAQGTVSVSISGWDSVGGGEISTNPDGGGDILVSVKLSQTGANHVSSSSWTLSGSREQSSSLGGKAGVEVSDPTSKTSPVGSVSGEVSGSATQSGTVGSSVTSSETVTKDTAGATEVVTWRLRCDPETGSLDTLSEPSGSSLWFQDSEYKKLN